MKQYLMLLLLAVLFFSATMIKSDNTLHTDGVYMGKIEITQERGSITEYHYIAFKPMRHVISAIVQNVPGVLAHISGMLASRGYNIDSLAVGETEIAGLSRMTFVVRGDDRVLEQVRKQLEKIVTVVSVQDISSNDYVERDLMLIKVSAPTGAKRSEIRELAEIFRARIVDVGPEELMIEISGRENKVQAFIERMRPYGINELVRTGRIAMVRGSNPNVCDDDGTSNFEQQSPHS